MRSVVFFDHVPIDIRMYRSALHVATLATIFCTLLFILLTLPLSDASPVSTFMEYLRQTLLLATSLVDCTTASPSVLLGSVPTFCVLPKIKIILHMRSRQFRLAQTPGHHSFGPQVLLQSARCMLDRESEIAPFSYLCSCYKHFPCHYCSYLTGHTSM